MADQVQVIGGAFQDAEGVPLTNGYLELYLDRDNSILDVGNLCAGIKVRIQLDSDGNAASDASDPVAENQFVWGNDVMLSPNSFYRVTGFTEAGQPAWGPNNQQIFGDGGTFDLGTWVPNQVISWTPPIRIPTLEVNESPFSSQSLLDFQDSDTVTFEDAGSGILKAHSTVIVPSLETNGVANADQALLDLEDNFYLTQDQSVGVSFEDAGAGIVRASAGLLYRGTIVPGGAAWSPFNIGPMTPGFSSANAYTVFVSYDSSAPLVNPGILSVNYVDGQNFQIVSSSASDASGIRWIVI